MKLNCCCRVMLLLSSVMASGACRSGDMGREESSRSRSRTLASMSLKFGCCPFVFISSSRRCARISGRAVMNILRSAFGNTVVPMSRPSIMTLCCRAMSRCHSVSLARTAGMAETALTFWLTGMSRISSSTFSVLRYVVLRVFCGSKLKVMVSECSSCVMAWVSGLLLLMSCARSAASVTARYMAPVSM